MTARTRMTRQVSAPTLPRPSLRVPSAEGLMDRAEAVRDFWSLSNGACPQHWLLLAAALLAAGWAPALMGVRADWLLTLPLALALLAFLPLMQAVGGHRSAHAVESLSPTALLWELDQPHAGYARVVTVLGQSVTDPQQPATYVYGVKPDGTLSAGYLDGSVGDVHDHAHALELAGYRVAVSA